MGFLKKGKQRGRSPFYLLSVAACHAPTKLKRRWAFKADQERAFVGKKISYHRLGIVKALEIITSRIRAMAEDGLPLSLRKWKRLWYRGQGSPSDPLRGECYF